MSLRVSLLPEVQLGTIWRVKIFLHKGYKKVKKPSLLGESREAKIVEKTLLQEHDFFRIFWLNPNPGGYKKERSQAAQGHI